MFFCGNLWCYCVVRDYNMEFIEKDFLLVLIIFVWNKSYKWFKVFLFFRLKLYLRKVKFYNDFIIFYVLKDVKECRKFEM